jgi:gliding motility-associated-like protein
LIFYFYIGAKFEIAFMRYKYSILSSLLFLVSLNAHSQLLYSDGALVHITNNVVVSVNGGVTISNGSDFTNDGTLSVAKINSTLPQAGTLIMNTGANVNGNGVIQIEQDWINDANFSADNGLVVFFGPTQQFITSTTNVVTTFNTLSLVGSGTGNNRKKTLQGVNAIIGPNGWVQLLDCELETQTNTFFVLNPSATCVTNTTALGNEAFVSSVAPGVLSRETNSNTAYTFPTGSSNGTFRYRPINIKPTVIGNNTYTARLNNTDPNIDGFNRANNDGSMCVINNLYYHSIERTAGSTSADIEVFYVASSDGNWTGMGHWNNISSNWNNMNTVAPATIGTFSTLTRSNWAFADPGHPYSLINNRPAKPSITCPTICENTGGNIFTLTGSNSNYQWSVPSGAIITSGQGTSNLTVNWPTGAGFVYAYAVGSPGCNSLLDSCQPSVFASPIAQFDAISDGSIYNNNYTFNNLSTGGTSWNWSFGDGTSSTSQTTSHQYTGAASYTVIMEVSNAGGCSDTASFVISTTEGINIPNVFSPNGDGINDEFFITSSYLDDFELSIFNRWGELVFKSDTMTKKWDGSYQGKTCQNGTYFFILKALSNGKDYGKSGYILLTGTK